MKVKLIVLLKSKDILAKVGEISFQDGLTGYRVYKNISNINKELENFDNFIKTLIEKYGEKQVDGSMKVVKYKDEYNKSLQPILEEEVEIEITKINPKTLGGLSPFEIMGIEWMLEQE